MNMIAATAREQGFRVISLLNWLKPFASNGLLYARDYSHWNKRGNRLSADLIGVALSAP